jgi:hypothetical protein
VRLLEKALDIVEVGQEQVPRTCYKREEGKGKI